MLRWILGFASVCALAAACGDSPRERDDDDDGSGAGAGSGGSASGGAPSGGSSSAGSSSDGGGGSEPAVPLCRQNCATPADCDLGVPAFDADNYTCDGTCQYLGCINDAECGPNVCRETFDPLMLVGGVQVCVVACGVAADCDSGGGPAYDADNYSCDDGGCVYTGCNDDSECQPLGNYACRDIGNGVSYCQIICNTPADCDIGGGASFDADNYSCDAGVCRYLGCHDDTECSSLGDYSCDQ